MPEQPEPAPVGQESGEKKSRRRVSCLAVFLGVVALLVVLGVGWSIYVGRQAAAFSRHVRELTAEVEAEKPIVDPADNAAPLYLHAFGLYVKPADWGEMYSEESCQPATIARHVADNAAYLEALKQAVGRPACDFGTDFSIGAGTDERYLFGLREACRFLKVAAWHHARAGRADQALRTAALGLRLARDAGTDGSMIPFMHQRGCEHSATKALVAVLNDSEPGAGALKKAIAGLEEHLKNRGVPLAEAVWREKVLTMIAVDRMVSGGATLEYLKWWPEGGGSNPLPRSDEKSDVQTFLFRVSGLAVKNARKLEAGFDAMARAAEQAGHPEQVEAVGEAYRDAYRFHKGGRVGWALAGDYLPGLLLPGAERVAVSDARALARLHLARLALGCRLYKLKHGKYPEKLSDLSKEFPEHFKTLPADPFSGKPLLYAKTKKGLKLWSVDRDRKDHGGTPYDSKKHSAGWDIVFELTR